MARGFTPSARGRRARRWTSRPPGVVSEKGAAPRRLRRALRVGATWAAIGALVVSGVIPVISAFATGTREPVEQISDKLETDGHKPLAGLYATALEADAFELSWIVIALPCPSQHFRLQTTTAKIANTQASSKEVEISILSAQLPPGVHCESGLPSDLDEGSATVTVSRAAAGGSIAAPTIAYADSETKILSFSPCMTLTSACRGRYVLRAYLSAPRSSVRLEYVFTVATVEDEPEKAPSERLGGVLPVAVGEVTQCPVR